LHSDGTLPNHGKSLFISFIPLLRWERNLNFNNIFQHPAATIRDLTCVGDLEGANFIVVEDC
jgi:hypothetical protein